MAREIKVYQQDAFYHVILRGNNGQNIFFLDRDRCRFCLLLQKALERFPHQIHGFCLMRNHVHLAIQLKAMSLSPFMHFLALSYAQYINRTQHRQGHLFQGRYHAFLVDNDNYLLELVRYIHLNPVRAGIVKMPEDYFWSGHNTYIGKNEIFWLTQSVILQKMDVNENSARKLLHKYVVEGIGEKFSPEFDKDFQKNNEFLQANAIINPKPVLNTKNVPFQLSLNDLITIVSSLTNFSLEDLQSRGKNSKLSQARGILAILVRKNNNIKFKDLADLLSKDSAALCRLATITEAEAHTNPELTKIIEDSKVIIKSLQEGQEE